MSGYMAMRGMPELLKWYSSTLKKTQDCRGDGEALTLLNPVSDVTTP
jgi:hypothetical protein